MDRLQDMTTTQAGRFLLKRTRLIAPLVFYAALLTGDLRAAAESAPGVPASSPARPSKTVPAEFPRYAGSASCEECHEEAYEEWLTSHHANAQRDLAPELDREAFTPKRTIKHGTQTSFADIQDGRYVMQNSACIEGWGDVIGHRPDDVAPDAKTLALWQSNNRRAFAGEIVEDEVILPTPEGTGYFRNIISPIRDGNEIRGILGINIDVTKRVRAEEALRKARDDLEMQVRQRTAELIDTNARLQQEVAERKRQEDALRASEQRYRMLFDTSPDGIASTTLDGRILDANPAFQAMLGYTLDELRGMTYQQLTPSRWHAKEDENVQAVLSQKGHATLEKEYTRKDGTVVPVALSGWILTDRQGRAAKLGAFVRDITEEKRAEQRIQRYQEQLRALAAEVSLAEQRERRRLAIDLHEGLGQMLTLVNIKLELMRQSALGPEAEELLEQVEELIGQLIRAARSLTFQLCPPALYDLGLAPAVKYLVEDVRQRYDLRVAVWDDGQPGLVDERVRVTLFRCLQELLINVAKHAGVDSARVRIERDNHSVPVIVEDDGVGFDPATQSGGAGGGGFGLFSIRERLRHLGGRAEIRSAPAEGATVTLEAPIEI